MPQYYSNGAIFRIAWLLMKYQKDRGGGYATSSRSAFVDWTFEAANCDVMFSLIEARFSNHVVYIKLIMHVRMPRVSVASESCNSQSCCHI
jgi:hypothetical protein